MKSSIHRFHKAINRSANKGLSSVIYLGVVGVCELAHLAIAQAAESSHSFIELRPFLSPHIISDFGGLLPDTVNPVAKLIPKLMRRTLDPGSKAAHKAPKLIYANLPRGFIRMSSVSGI